MQKHIVFVDNLSKHWNGDMDTYAKKIDYIRVPNTSHNTEPKYTKRLAKKGNQYATALLRTGSRNFVNKGIDQTIAGRLKKWSFIQTPEQKYAIFDWDGTISSSEGFSLDALSPPMQFTSPMMDFLLPTYRGGKTANLPKKYRIRQKTRKYRDKPLHEMVGSPEYQNILTQHITIPSKEFLDDMFVYMMRPDRVEMLRGLFHTLLSNNVQVHVFTQNPYASTANPYRKIFIEMMSRLFNSRDLDSMLHSTIDYTNPEEPALKRNMLRGFI